MGASVYNWILVYEDGTTKMTKGDTPEMALEDVDYSDQYNIVSMVRTDWS